MIQYKIKLFEKYKLKIVIQKSTTEEIMRGKSTRKNLDPNFYRNFSFSTS